MLCYESRVWCDGKMDDGMLGEEDVTAIKPCGELPESEFETTQLGREVCCWVPRLDWTTRFARRRWDGSSDGYRSSEV